MRLKSVKLTIFRGYRATTVIMAEPARLSERLVLA